MSQRGWGMARAGALLLAVALVSPVGPGLLVGVPLALLLLAFRLRDPLALGLGVVILALTFRGAPEGPAPLWFAERGWCLLAGGAFVAAGVLRPTASLLGRGLAAVGAALAAAVVTGLLRPAFLPTLDWRVSAQIRDAARVARALIGRLEASGASGWTEGMGEAMLRWTGFQQEVYPAFLALATLGGLALAWMALAWVAGRGRGLGPIREFRFSDQLVWILIGSLALLLLPAGEGAFRIGENAALFMGALYLLRGAAVLLWLSAMLITSAWAAVLWSAVALVLYPVVLGSALVLGLSDTWLDVRGRLRGAGADDES